MRLGLLLLFIFATLRSDSFESDRSLYCCALCVPVGRLVDGGIPSPQNCFISPVHICTQRPQMATLSAQYPKLSGQLPIISLREKNTITSQVSIRFLSLFRTVHRNYRFVAAFVSVAFGFKSQFFLLSSSASFARLPIVRALVLPSSALSVPLSRVVGMYYIDDYSNIMSNRKSAIYRRKKQQHLLA